MQDEIYFIKNFIFSFHKHTVWESEKNYNILITNDYFLCPDDAIRTPTATININSILMRNMYVLLEDLLYSPNRSIPQNVLTNGSA